MAYRAEIEIGVKGIEQFGKLQKAIDGTIYKINELNRKSVANFGGVAQSIDNYTKQLSKAEIALDRVAAGTVQETRAISNYVTAMGNANAMRARQNYLIEQEIANRRKLQVTVNAGFGLQGPALPPSFTDAGFGIQGPAALKASQVKARSTPRVSKAISSAIIGGSFPLLFGQGGGAAAGGAIGGIAGELALGPAGGFAGSLLGTLIGDIASQSQKIKQLGTDIGFSAQQTTALADGFKKANIDIDKFTAVIENIRGLGLELKDQAELIRLTTTLTEKYGGQFDKVGNAITSALESGKVSQATLNQLTSQGIDVQQALADKLGISKDRLLEMAKKGQISTQNLIDTLVDMGNKAQQAVEKPASGFDRLSKETKNLGNALGDLGSAIMKILSPALDWLSARLAEVISLAAKGIQYTANLLSGGTASTALANARARQRLSKEGGPSTGTRYLTLEQQAKVNAYAQEELKKIDTVKPLAKINVTGLGQAAPSGRGGSKAAENAAKRLAEQTQQQLIASGALLTDEQNRLKVLGTTDELQKLDLEYEKIRGDRFQKFVKLYKESLSDKERSNIFAAQSAAIAADDLKYQQDKAKILADQTAEYYAQIGLADVLSKKFQASVSGAFLPGRQMPGFRTDISLSPGITGGPLSEQQRITQEELNKLIEPANQVATAAESIGTAFSNSFKSVVTGAQSAQQALAGFFQSVASAFLDMAAQIIAKWITLTILNTVVKLFPSASPTNYSSVFSAGGGLGSSQYGAGALNLGLKGFATGGFVTGPTKAIVGEGSQSEYIIPANKMSAAMSRYSAGARGSAVIPTGDGNATMGTNTSTTLAPGAIDVRYTIERINSVDYVTNDQFQQGMAQAAKQGAQQGEQRTLRRLQMSNSTRKKVGI